MDSRQVRKPGAADPTREMRPSGSYRVQFASAEDNGRHGLVKGLLERPDHGPDRCVARSSGEVGQLAEEVVTEQGRGYCWMAGGAQLSMDCFYFVEYRPGGLQKSESFKFRVYTNVRAPQLNASARHLFSDTSRDPFRRVIRSSNNSYFFLLSKDRKRQEKTGKGARKNAREKKQESRLQPARGVRVRGPAPLTRALPYMWPFSYGGYFFPTFH